MQLKKLLQGSAFALVAAACAIAVPSVVKAADVTGTTTETGVGTVAVDGEKAQLTVTGATDKEVLVGFAKVNAKGKVTVAAWDTYDGTTATVDLSKLSNTKDNYVALTTPSKLATDAITIVKIPATKKVVKAEFDASTATVKYGEADKGKPEMKVFNTTASDPMNAEGYEYRTAYTAWASMKGQTDVVDLKLYQEEGATLFIRKKGTKTTWPTGQAEGKYTFGANDKLQAYEVTSTLPGKEAKLAIKARAKGPKATADYLNGKVKLPKGAEYRLCSSTKLEDANTTTKKYNEVGAAAKTMTIAELTTGKDAVVTTTTTEFDLEVRTAADTTKKKAASKWSRLTVSVPKALTDIAAGAGKALVNTGTDLDSKKVNGNLPAQTTSDQEGGGTGIKAAVLKEEGSETSSLLAVNYVVKGILDKTKYYTSNAVEIQNNGKAAYEIIVGGKSDTKAPEGKPTKIAAGKKIVLTKVEDGSTVWIRKAGDKKTKTWVSDYAKLGVIDHTYKVPKQETQTP